MATGLRSQLSVRKHVLLCSLNVLPLSVIDSLFLLLFITRGWISIGFTLLSTLIGCIPCHVTFYLPLLLLTMETAFTSFSCRYFFCASNCCLPLDRAPWFLLWFLQWDVQDEFWARDAIYISILLTTPIPQVTFVLLQGARVSTEQWTRALLYLLQRSHSYYRNTAEEPKLGPYLQITTLFLFNLLFI